MNDLISRQLLDLWNRYKPTIVVDAIEYDRELKKLLGTNLASLGTDCISRRQAIEAFRTYFMDGFDEDKWWNSTHVLAAIEGLPPAEPKRETATVSVGKSKGGVTMWYECAACGEPVDQGDTFCSGCGRRLIHG